MAGLVFVLVAGFLIGYERGSRGVPAGVRTHTLVCLGAMLLTVTSITFDVDAPTRIASSIVTGIGFLGAGIIMHQRRSIHGLTTAATIWLVAAIGITIGLGFYMTSVLATLGAFVVLKLPHLGEHGYPPIESAEAKAEKKKPPRKRRKR